MAIPINPFPEPALTPRQVLQLLLKDPAVTPEQAWYVYLNLTNPTQGKHR
jgi:hypothetical protein